jgi:hypothetical protein
VEMAERLFAVRGQVIEIRMLEALLVRVGVV